MGDVDFTKCEQPDELIQLAWNAGLDRKAVIRAGSNAARLLLARERTEVVVLFWPVPRPLEAVDRWSENPRHSAGTSERLRPYASAVVPGCAIGTLVTQLFVAPRMSYDRGLTALVWIIVASIVVLGVVFKVLIDMALRRRVARLDHEKALSIVLQQLRRGMAVAPALVPHTVTQIRRSLALAGARPSG